MAVTVISRRFCSLFVVALLALNCVRCDATSEDAAGPPPNVLPSDEVPEAYAPHTRRLSAVIADEKKAKAELRDEYEKTKPKKGGELLRKLRAKRADTHVHVPVFNISDTNITAFRKLFIRLTGHRRQRSLFLLASYDQSREARPPAFVEDYFLELAHRHFEHADVGGFLRWHAVTLDDLAAIQYFFSVIPALMHASWHLSAAVHSHDYDFVGHGPHRGDDDPELLRPRMETWVQSVISYSGGREMDIARGTHNFGPKAHGQAMSSYIAERHPWRPKDSKPDVAPDEL